MANLLPFSFSISLIQKLACSLIICYRHEMHGDKKWVD